MDILNIQHLTKVYGKGDCATRALDDVTLSVPEGQFLAIVGSSGSGKSTLLHLMGGVDRPTSGSVYLAATTCIRATTSSLRYYVAARWASSISSSTSFPPSRCWRT